MRSLSWHTTTSGVCIRNSFIRPLKNSASTLNKLSSTKLLRTANTQTRDGRSIRVGAAVGTVEKYGVYMQEQALNPLKEGESKHVISIFVADEAGLINRVAGVFGRRGANIESLAVGLTADKALFTVVVTGSDNTVSNLNKQISKLVSVMYVEDITKTNRVEREMMLIKVRVQAGSERTEVMQLAQIFRAKINDVSEDTLTLCVAGDIGKLATLQKIMSKFGILEIARTGRISLPRGQRLNSQELSHKKLASKKTTMSSNAGPVPAKENEVFGVFGSAMPEDDQDAIWDVQNILEPVYEEDVSVGTNIKAHTLSIEVSDMPGVLNQVTGVFGRRGYNIQSLAVGPCEKPNTSRICMVVPGTEESIQKLFKQLGKLVYVQSMVDLTYVPFVNRELMLVKVKCTPAQVGQLRHLEQIFRGNILDVSPTSAIMEIVGKKDKLKALTDLLGNYGILEIARTGRIALPRESGLDSPFLERMVTSKPQLPKKHSGVFLQ